MSGLKNRHIVSFWIIPASLGLMLLILFFISCDEVERHKTLSFFFDGVPPLGSENLQGVSFNPNAPESAQEGQATTWYVHEPIKDCSTCHGKRRHRGFSSQIHLIAPVPKLCYECHADFTESASFVHGPVAVGQCLLCHNQHRTKIKHLLIAPEPGLCYHCHDINTIELIAAHLPGQLSSCTNCHDPHSSSVKGLLKENIPRTNYEFEQPKTPDTTSSDNIGVTNGQDEQIDSIRAATAPTAQTEGGNISEVFQEARKLIEQGELEKARVYLEQFRDSASFTAKEREQIVRVLEMIDSVTNRDKQQLDKDKQAKEIAELYYSSMAFYRTGQLMKAREGFVKVLKSGLIPESMAKTIRGYVSDIDNSLAGNK